MQKSHSDCALIDCAERDGTYITLSCVLFSIVVDLVIAYVASGAYFTNADYRLIRLTSPPINPDYRGFTVFCLSSPKTNERVLIKLNIRNLG
jgi:hypothetical protein